MARPNYLPASGKEWDRARIKALARDDCRCQAHTLGLCDEPCTEDNPRHLIVHHIQYRINGGTHDLDNLITLCRAHHADIHPHLRFQLPDAKLEVDDDDTFWLKRIEL